MTAFTYQAFSTAGTSTGTVDAADIESAKEKLAAQGLLVSDLKQVKRKGFNKEISIRKTLKLGEAAWVARQLAVMTGSGTPLPRALSMLANQREGKKTGTILEDIQRQIVDGNRVSDSFRSHEQELGSLFVAMIDTGEKSGKLAESLDRLASLLERRNRLRKQVRSALVYPAGVFVTTTGIALGMVLFVVPVFRSIFAELGGHLPLPTQVLIAVSHILLTNLWILPVAVIGGVVGWRRARKSHDWHRRIDAAFLRIPVVGHLLSKAALARVSSTLAITLAVGVHLIEALDYAAASASNYVFADALRAAAEEVAGGKALSVALAAQKSLPEILSQMAEVGENAGSINETLSRYSEQASQEVDIAVEGLTAAMEPVLMIVLGTMVGGIVISLYLPMFRVITLIGSQKP